MVIEKLNNKNTEYFNALLDEARRKTKFRVDFYRYYDNKAFLFKYFVKKLVKLIKLHDEYIGYIWVEVPSTSSIRISDMYIKEEYLKYFNENLPLILKSNLVIYEGLEDEYQLAMVSKLKMSRIRLTQLMKLNNSIEIHKRRSNAVFLPYEKKRDAKLRCMIQNAIFKDDSRTPLSIEDIEYDEKQDYYINELCTFIKVDSKIIGYGQIIFNRGIYSLVNFGIIDKYRAQGYGEDLIIKLIEMAKNYGIDELYIRVDYNNLPAKRLYTNVGFEEIGNFSTWIWAQELLK
ncbi:GNAT family N-acetyltransferase [Clostridium paraputrificum]|uniref:GNAT family N-acetyltransferase n=1 Tax=Clostridium TaxID=1485 RepID=UPI003D329437